MKEIPSDSMRFYRQAAGLMVSYDSEQLYQSAVARAETQKRPNQRDPICNGLQIELEERYFANNKLSDDLDRTIMAAELMSAGVSDLDKLVRLMTNPDTDDIESFFGAATLNSEVAILANRRSHALFWRRNTTLKHILMPELSVQHISSSRDGLALSQEIYDTQESRHGCPFIGEPIFNRYIQTAGKLIVCHMIRTNQTPEMSSTS